jgi:hypothetical protein
MKAAVKEQMVVRVKRVDDRVRCPSGEMERNGTKGLEPGVLSGGWFN